MKHYKLIKEYPGSPKLGNIAKFENDDKWYYHYLPKLQDNGDLSSIGCHEITLYPEFWEEVVEKEFIILKLISTEYNKVHPVGTIHTITNQNYEHFVTDILNENYWDIYEILRISDNVVFKLQDLTQAGIITSIHISSLDKSRLIISSIKNSTITSQSLQDVKKEKEEYLFLTKDNVPIFLKDLIHFTSIEQLKAFFVKK